jgi:hypothetical protein
MDDLPLLTTFSHRQQGTSVYRLFPRRRSRGFDPFSRMEDSDILRITARNLLVIRGLESGDKAAGFSVEQSSQGFACSIYFRLSIIRVSFDVDTCD